MDRKEYAVEKFKKDCNCCQAVLCAFTDEAGEEERRQKCGKRFHIRVPSRGDAFR